MPTTSLLSTVLRSWNVEKKMASYLYTSQIMGSILLRKYINDWIILLWISVRKQLSELCLSIWFCISISMYHVLLWTIWQFHSGSCPIYTSFNQILEQVVLEVFCIFTWKKDTLHNSFSYFDPQLMKGNEKVCSNKFCLQKLYFLCVNSSSEGSLELRLLNKDNLKKKSFCIFIHRGKWVHFILDLTDRMWFW